MPSVDARSRGRSPQRGNAGTRKHGLCQRCKEKSGGLTLCCTQELENPRQYSWVCKQCVKELAQAKAARKEKLRLRVEAAGACKERDEARSHRKRLLGGDW
jgi:hypothetical protein